MKDLKLKVEKLLEKKPKTRGSDELLYIEIIKKYDAKALDFYAVDFFKSARLMGLPSYETVSRTRRKVQAERPELLPEKCMQKKRMTYEKKCHDFLSVDTF